MAKANDQVDELFSISEKLEQLAKGVARNSLVKESGCKVPLALTKYCSNQYILWQIDVDVDPALGLFQQHIKVWDLAPKSELAQTIRRISSLHQTYSSDLIRCCREQADSKELTPKLFERSVLLSSSEAADPNGFTLDSETLEVASKFYGLSLPVLQAIRTGLAAMDYPMALDYEQTQIVRYAQSSTLILGRSGTGKTSCLIMKALARYIASKRGGNPAVRQVLLTTSPFLANKIAEHTKDLLRTLRISEDKNVTTAGQPAVSDQCDNQSRDIMGLTSDSFPFVCTFDAFLEMLRKTIT